MIILTYLGFTMLSILIQFGVMDLIFVRNQHPDLNVSSHQIKNNIQKALYFRKPVDNVKKFIQTTKVFDNTSINSLFVTSTDISSTNYDVFFEDNVSTTEYRTTESLATSTEIDNITEITLFEIKNNTEKPNQVPKNHIMNTKNCNCDLLYGTCDINCCCDSDCTINEHKMFYNCTQTGAQRKKTYNFCPLQALYMGDNSKYQDGYMQNLFCAVHSNIPKRNKIIKMYDADVVSRIKDSSYMWGKTLKLKSLNEFKKKMYEYGDALWLLKNESIYYMDLPSQKLNSYCSGRSPVMFLKDETIKCNVKLNDLEMLRILEASQDTMVVSPKLHSINTTVLNCTTLHCTNWTIMTCDNEKCLEYNKSLHEPTCTDNYCTNLSFNLEYIFNYYDSKVANATIKFYTRKVTLLSSLLPQEVKIRFILANESVDRIILLSGNPGYMLGLPVIASYVEGNHSVIFFNHSDRHYLYYPEGDGSCKVSTNSSDLHIKFGWNIRKNCKITQNFNSNNVTCKVLQNQINSILQLNNKIYISPYGNPHNVIDKDWVPIETNNVGNVFEEINEKTKKLHCYNLITRVSFIFTYADVSSSDIRTNKIVSVEMKSIPRNVTFNIEDFSTSVTVTVDTNFIDVTNNPMYEYAGPPQLNFHLPADFFFPFTYNNAVILTCNSLVYCIVIFILILK